MKKQSHLNWMKAPPPAHILIALHLIEKETTRTNTHVWWLPLLSSPELDEGAAAGPQGLEGAWQPPPPGRQGDVFRLGWGRLGANGWLPCNALCPSALCPQKH